MSDNSNWYRNLTIRRPSGLGHIRGQGAKRVAGADTTIVTGDTTDPGASGIIKVTIDGSTMTVDVGAFQASATDGSPALLTNFKGGILAQAQSGTVTDATLDANTIADVVAVGGSPFFITEWPNAILMKRGLERELLISRNFNLFPPPFPFITQLGGKRILY